MSPEIRELSTDQLRRVCEPKELKFESTAELPELSQIIGQERATRAIDFGIDIPCYGYNIYVLGPSGSGRMTTIQTFLERKARERPVPDDWVYVNNFEDQYSPRAIGLPPGEGGQFRDDMDELIKNLRDEIPRAFESEEYAQHQTRIVRELEEKRKEAFQSMEAYASEQGFALGRVATGLVIVPKVEDKVLSPEEYEQLDEETRRGFEARRPIVQEELEKAMRQMREVEKDTKSRLRNLDQEIAAFASGHFFDALKEKYADNEELVTHLEAMRQDIIQKVDLFKGGAEGAEGEEAARPLPAPLPSRFASPFDRYRVNVIVDHYQTEGAPVVVETNPTYYNLIGRIEHKAEFGALVTDFSMIKGGSLHQANGGYLIVDARAVLGNPLVWDSLKRSLRNKEIRLEEMSQQFSLVATVGLAPEPIPLEVKVVLIGDPTTYYLLYSLDDEFQKLFKVRADFASDMDWTPENEELYALFIHARCQEENLKHFEQGAVARVVEYGSRLVEDQRKLTTRFAHVADIVREASYWASRNGHELVTAADVQQAIEERVYRSNQVEERLRERIGQGTIMVDTEGEVVGQVNGLSIIFLGDYAFGRPSRITARTYMGQAGVINIEREAKLSGNIHDKGVLILSGYLGGKYAQDVPLSLSASLCFEQSYEGVEGDSASSTELYALLSSLAGLSIKQSIAVTGSVNQQGEIQPVGGVTQKVEGFFDVCRVQGLTGQQGVIIPEQNIPNLILREEVVEAVRQGKFHLYPVSTIDEGMTILTGLEAGERQEDGSYPAGTVNYAVAQRLHQLAKGLKEFGKEEDEGQQKPESSAAEDSPGET